MKQQLEQLLKSTIEQLQQQEQLPKVAFLIQIEATRDKQFGDFAANTAMLLAKAAKKNPRQIAELIVKHIPDVPYLEKVAVAGPGFINFYLSAFALTSIVEKVLSEKEAYGSCTIGRGKRILLEFVSSNPTGPLHVGHGRHAAFGLVVANLLEEVGFKPYKEYYVNDAGRQMDILTVSVWVRYLNLCGENIPFPANAYRGDYVSAIAKKVLADQGRFFYATKLDVTKDLPLDEDKGGDKELYIDALIGRAKTLLKDNYQILFDIGCQDILHDIKDDLEEFGVHYDNWFSERAFIETGVVDALLQKLERGGHVYQQDGALWFKATDFGDVKDRVIVRSNGQRTYFANDLVYHLEKFERGFDIAIDILGSDHHGYLQRMKAALQAAGINPERLIILLLQFVTLYRGPVQVQMSTRGGNFITLRELRHEVGNDAARFFYLMRKADQHMDFDLELAKSQSNENPLYYIQYAYARIASVFRQMHERGLTYDEPLGLANINLLTEHHERDILTLLTNYPEMIINAALNYEPHLLTNYLRDLAHHFHSYYNAHAFLVDDENVRNARLTLVQAVRQILLNGLSMLAITPPETM